MRRLWGGDEGGGAWSATRRLVAASAVLGTRISNPSRPPLPSVAASSAWLTRKSHAVGGSDCPAPAAAPACPPASSPARESAPLPRAPPARISRKLIF